MDAFWLGSMTFLIMVLTIRVEVLIYKLYGMMKGL